MKSEQLKTKGAWESGPGCKKQDGGVVPWASQDTLGYPRATVGCSAGQSTRLGRCRGPRGAHSGEQG